MNFEEYEELLKNSFRKSMFDMAHKKIKEFYSDEFLVYPKCIFGNREATIYYISSEKLVTVSFGFLEEYNSNEFPIEITENKAKLLSKILILHQDNGGNIELKINYENGIELNFHNLNDSNSQMSKEYYESIKSIFKAI